MRVGGCKQGFSLVELLVVIVIVVLLTGISVPLYTEYVRSSRRTEAAGGLAMIAASQQTYYQRSGTYANALANLDVDLSDLSPQWDIGDPSLIAGPPPGFSCTATGKAGSACAGLGVTMTYSFGGGKSLLDEAGKPL